MIDNNAFAKMVPGFDFLQSLMQGAAGQGVPAMGQWVAPTLNPEELEKRISEMKTLQFWLEQNARMIGMTVQALEVQRMTLSTLKSMNLPMADLRSALTLPTAPPPAPFAPFASSAPSAPPAPAERPADPPAAAAPAAPAEGAAEAKPAVDPMQWWGALTQQFTEIATKAMQDSSALTARNLAAGGTAAAATKKSGMAAPAKSTAARPARKRKA